MRVAEYAAGDEHAICARLDTQDLVSEPARPRGEGSSWRGDGTLDISRPEAVTPALWLWRHGYDLRRRPWDPRGQDPQAAAGQAYQPWAYVAWEGRDLVGHAAAVPSRLLIGGRPHRAAQIFFDRKVEREPFLALHLALFEQLRGDGVEVVYALAQDRDMPAYHSLELLPLFELHARNLYLGLNALSTRLDEQALGLVRRLAREARRFRTKLIEVTLDDIALAQAARLIAIARESNEPELAIEKEESWLRWRYLERPDTEFRMLVLRRRAGKGIDAFAIVRVFEVEPGRSVIQLLDHATRAPGRRALAWMLGEVAVWGLAEKADVLQGYAASGSELDQALVRSGFLRKKRERTLMAKWIGRPPTPVTTPFTTRRVDLHSGDVEL